MAVLEKDQFFDRLHTFIGDTQDDAAIAFMEDMTDTYKSLEQQATGDAEHWRQKYEANDASWRKKYTQRFFSSGGGDYNPETGTADEPSSSKDITFDDIFRKKES